MTATDRSRPGGKAGEQNRFTVVRQLRYSGDETQRALDIGLLINGLPVFTFELKNRLTKQTVADAVWQYKNDRNPRKTPGATRRSPVSPSTRTLSRSWSPARTKPSCKCSRN